jgi:dephospho-CoA kinase
MQRRLSIGLTGGIGSGKSTVAALWVQCGAALIDTDAIAHELTAPGGAAMPALRRTFGDDIADASGALDRGRMRALVFADPSAKRRLESILHPMIGETARSRADDADAPVIVYDVPLLAESNAWRARCDRILVVDCGESTQIARVVARSGWTEEQVRSVIAQQASRERRRAIADAVIHNDGIDSVTLAHEVQALWATWWRSPAV